MVKYQGHACTGPEVIEPASFGKAGERIHHSGKLVVIESDSGMMSSVLGFIPADFCFARCSYDAQLSFCSFAES